MSSLVTAQHAEELSTGARQLGVALTESQHQQLLGYLALLIKWNKAYNLTAVRNPDEMVSRHLLDSLSVMPFIENGRWLDAAGLDGCIAVQARACTGETDQLLLLAERYPWIRAVVGWVDLCARDLEPSLERWAQAPVLRGFRHQLQDES